MIFDVLFMNRKAHPWMHLKEFDATLFDVRNHQSIDSIKSIKKKKMKSIYLNFKL